MSKQNGGVWCHNHWLFLLMLFIAITPATAHGSSSSIHWRVENPFRLFLDPADTAVHRAAFKSLSPYDQSRPILAAEQLLSAMATHGWAEPMINRICWSAKAQRYACSGFNDYANPVSHRVIAIPIPLVPAQLLV
jgi:hypothetical protein